MAVRKDDMHDEHDDEPDTETNADNFIFLTSCNFLGDIVPQYSQYSIHFCKKIDFLTPKAAAKSAATSGTAEAGCKVMPYTKKGGSGAGIDF